MTAAFPLQRLVASPTASRGHWRAAPAAVRRWLVFPKAHRKASERTNVGPLSADVDSATPKLRSISQTQRSGLPSGQAFWVPLLALAGFSATAFLVCASDPSNFLLALDHNVQQWVVSTIPPEIRSTVFARNISNLFIEFDLVVGFFALSASVLSNQKRGILLTVLSAAFFYAGVGSHRYEGWLVGLLKGVFHRPRPIDGMISYAFPSGHATSAVFLTGALLFVWLPAAQQTLKNAPAPQNSMSGNKLLFWGTSFLCTMTGRVGGNVHWVSDTVAGCLLGVALTSLFKSLNDALDRRIID